MKTTLKSLLVGAFVMGTCVAATSILTSCGANSNNADNSAKVDVMKTDFELMRASAIYQITDTAITNIFEEKDMYTQSVVDIQWPTCYGDSVTKGLQDALLKQCFPTDTVSKDINAAIKVYLSTPNPTDSLGFSMVKEKAYVDSAPSTDRIRFYKSITAKTIQFNNRLVVYEIANTNYEGGAHGLTTTSYIVYDVKGNKVVTFADMFKGEEVKSIIKDAIVGQLKATYNVTDEQGLIDSGIDVDSIDQVKDVYVKDFNIVFHYNPYQIAPYAVGEINVSIPYYDIKDILSDKAIEMFPL